jgi:hypothetical protein
MNRFKWVLAASLAVATTGCVETVDSNYPSGGGYGYADSGYSSGYSNSYYAPTYYAPAYTASRGDTYYAPRSSTPQVVREARSAPVPQARPTHEPQPQQHQADRGNDHASTNAGSGTNNTNHGTQPVHRDHNGHDSDSQPDRRS